MPLDSGQKVDRGAIDDRLISLMLEREVRDATDPHVNWAISCVGGIFGP